MSLPSTLRNVSVMGAFMALVACQTGTSSVLANDNNADDDLTSNTQGMLTAQVNPNACLDVVEASRTSGAAVQMWSCGGGANQLWRIKSSSVQVYKKLCLSVSGTANGAGVIVVTCDTTDASQAWSVNGVQLVHTATGKCLDVRDGGHANGTRAQIWDCYKGSSNQTWVMPNQTAIASDTNTTATTTGTTTTTASTTTTTASSTGVANVDAAVTQSVTFTDWGITGGFTAMPLTNLLALHPQLATYEQAFITAAAQSKPVVPPQLLVAICLQESSGGLDLSTYGGPFQFSDDSAWAEYGPSGGDRNNMADAAIGAANYMAALLNQNNGDLNAALRAYNGPIADGGLPAYQADIQSWMQGVLVYGTGV